MMKSGGACLLPLLLIHVCVLCLYFVLSNGMEYLQGYKHLVARSAKGATAPVLTTVKA